MSTVLASAEQATPSHRASASPSSFLRRASFHAGRWNAHGLERPSAGIARRTGRSAGDAPRLRDALLHESPATTMFQPAAGSRPWASSRAGSWRRPKPNTSWESDSVWRIGSSLRFRLFPGRADRPPEDRNESERQHGRAQNHEREQRRVGVDRLVRSPR